MTQKKCIYVIQCLDRNGDPINDKTDTSAIYFVVRTKAGKVGTVTGATTASFGGFYLKRFDILSLVDVLSDYKNTSYELNITKDDAVNKTISGNFVIQMSGTAGTVSVTEGEFIDLKYTQK